jgi:dolichyl-phosphate-mannose--protein O-mannosyl transferase
MIIYDFIHRFWGKFVELHFAMLKMNDNLEDSHPYSSSPCKAVFNDSVMAIIEAWDRLLEKRI